MKLTDVLAGGLIIAAGVGGIRSLYLACEEIPLVTERTRINRDLGHIKNQLERPVNYRTLAENEYSLPRREITRIESILTQEKELRERHMEIEKDPKYQEERKLQSEKAITGIATMVAGALSLAYMYKKRN